jgi:hypothetical protein
MTALAYAYAGLYSVESASLIPIILPSLAIGVPIGAQLIRRIRPETFRRICMSFDAWIVGFGLSGVLQQLQVITGRPPTRCSSAWRCSTSGCSTVSSPGRRHAAHQRHVPDRRGAATASYEPTRS